MKMRNVAVLGAVLALSGVVGGLLALREKPVSQALPSPTVVGSEVTSSQGLIGSDKVPLASTKVIPEPLALTGFHSSSRQAQLDAITALESNPRLDDQIVAFLGYELAADRSLDDVTRNNIANALLIQDQGFSGLSETLAHMVHDQAESSTWRSYALQHLATAYERVNGADPSIPKVLLAAMLDADNSVACTAMIQLNRLERDKFMQLDSGYTQAVIARLRANESDDSVVAITIIPILGERREKTALPEIRKLAQNSDPHVRRVAIAALGQMGDATDLALLKRSLGDGNELVEIAAHGAIARLERNGRE